MAIVTIAHNSFRRSSLRFLETEDVLRVGMFIRLQDKEEKYQGTFLIIETAPSTSWSGQHVHLVVFPLGVQGETPKLYTLRGKKLARP